MRWILGVVCLIVTFGKSYTADDTLQVNQLIQEFKEFRHEDREKAMSFLQEALAMSEKLQYRRGISKTSFLIGNAQIEIGQYPEAKMAFQKALQYCDQRVNRGAIQISLGNVCRETGEYPKALQHYLEGLKISEQLDHASGIVAGYSNIANLYMYQGDIESALPYYQKAAQVQQAAGANWKLGVIYNSIAGCLRELDRPREESIELTEKALKLLQEAEHLPGQATSYGNLGVYALELGDSVAALAYNRKMIALNRQLGQKRKIATGLTNAAIILLAMDSLAEAKAMALEGLSLAEEIGAVKETKTAHGALADVFRAEGDFEKALDHLVQRVVLSDTLLNADILEQNKMLEKRYQLEKKDREIAQAIQSREAAEAANRQQLILLIGGGMVLTFGLIILLLMSRQRKAKDARRRIELEQKALRAQMNPHFIFNSLNSIQRMYLEGKSDVANDYMGDFAELMRKILDNSGQEAIPLKEELRTLQLYIELEQLRSGGMVEYAIEVDEEIDQLNRKVPPLIIQPFVENAIWHGILPKKQKGKVRVSLQLQDLEIACSVEDDGVGYGGGAQRTGHQPQGIAITEQRIGSRVHIHPRSGGGTCVTFMLPSV